MPETEPVSVNELGDIGTDPTLKKELDRNDATAVSGLLNTIGEKQESTSEGSETQMEELFKQPSKQSTKKGWIPPSSSQAFGI